MIDSGDDYMRWSNGVQICFGTKSKFANNATVGLPKPFADDSYRCLITQKDLASGWSDNLKSNAQTTTGFNVNSGGTSSFDWLAVGKWK